MNNKREKKRPEKRLFFFGIRGDAIIPTHREYGFYYFHNKY